MRKGVYRVVVDALLETPRSEVAALSMTVIVASLPVVVTAFAIKPAAMRKGRTNRPHRTDQSNNHGNNHLTHFVPPNCTEHL